MLRDDGNLVGYNGPDFTYDENSVFWSTNIVSDGKGPYKLWIEDSNNLVIYDGNNVALWESNSNDKGSFGNGYLILKDNRDIQIVDRNNAVLWSANTSLVVILCCWRSTLLSFFALFSF